MTCGQLYPVNTCFTCFLQPTNDMCLSTRAQTVLKYKCGCLSIHGSNSEQDLSTAVRSNALAWQEQFRPWQPSYGPLSPTYHSDDTSSSCQNVSRHSVCGCPLLSLVGSSLCISPTSTLQKSNRTCTHKSQLHFSAAYFSCNNSVTALHVTLWLTCASSANVGIVLASRHQCLCLLPKRVNVGGIFVSSCGVRL